MDDEEDLARACEEARALRAHAAEIQSQAIFAAWLFRASIEQRRALVEQAKRVRQELQQLRERAERVRH